MKVCLGIESTAHTFGVGIVSFDGQILANVKDTFTTTRGGLIPNEVAKHHEAVKEGVVERAFERAKLSWRDIDLIAVSCAPGLSPCLHVGVRFAKVLASTYAKPLVGVNHSVAHLSIGDLLCKVNDPLYVYVSGPNTQVIGCVGGKFRVFGETLDVGLGNMLDKFARELELGFPGGPKVEVLAKQGSKFLELSYSVKGMDVSFAGLLTKALRLYKEGASKEDVCFSVQETAFAMLVEVVERALAHTGKKELLLIGGVGANKRLCEMLSMMCVERGVVFHVVPLEFAGDQGTMIAWQGVLQCKANDVRVVEIRPYERVDEVDVFWK